MAIRLSILFYDDLEVTYYIFEQRGRNASAVDVEGLHVLACQLEFYPTPEAMSRYFTFKKLMLRPLSTRIIQNQAHPKDAFMDGYKPRR